jgi:hypothetical protein
MALEILADNARMTRRDSQQCERWPVRVAAALLPFRSVCTLIAIARTNCACVKPMKRRSATMSSPDSTCPRISRFRTGARMARSKSFVVNSRIPVIAYEYPNRAFADRTNRFSSAASAPFVKSSLREVRRVCTSTYHLRRNARSTSHTAGMMNAIDVTSLPGTDPCRSTASASMTGPARAMSASAIARTMHTSGLSAPDP